MRQETQGRTTMDSGSSGQETSDRTCRSHDPLGQATHALTRVSGTRYNNPA
jgi:hypothetical protein